MSWKYFEFHISTLIIIGMVIFMVGGALGYGLFRGPGYIVEEHY